jgi:protein phosphatase
MRLSVCSKTDKGLQRHRNEDVGIARPAEQYCLVADGMGGQAGGEIASNMFAAAAGDVFQERAELGESAGVLQVRTAFDLANTRILSYARDYPAFAGMGCTGDILRFCGSRFVLGHIGDSRTYLLRDGILRQLTKDHTLVESQIEQGLLSRQEARNSQFRSILLRAVGSAAKLEVDLLQDDLLAGDIFLLCSDGLHGMVEDEPILAVLAYDAPLDLKAGLLVTLANDAGGKDDITVVLAQVE